MMEYKKNTEIELDITDISNEGEGIGKSDGFPFFVKDALPGDRILASVTKAKKNYAYARLVRIISPSRDRVEARCPIARSCGGCRLQELDYGAQLAFKERKVKNDIIRLGGVPQDILDKAFEGIDGMEAPFRYRNKAQYPFGRDRNGNIIYGFYAGRTHEIKSCDDCLLSSPDDHAILEVIKGWLLSEKLSPYDEKTGRGLLRHVLIRRAFSSGAVMVCLVVNSKEFPHRDVLIKRLTGMGKNITSVSYSENTERTNVIMGKNYHTIYGTDTIRDSIGGLSFEISPLSFYQVNPFQTEKLYSHALEFAALKGNETVWDLYCGIGTISLFLASKAGMVCGVEIVPQAIEDAKKNALINHIDKVQFFTGAAETVLPEYYSAVDASTELLHPDVIVVDPPRKGCDEKCLETMVKMQPDRIVYVSCDPATLSRDIKYLRANNYELRRLHIVDMFPQSVHVEVVSLLQRMSNRKYKPDAKVKIDVDLEDYYRIKDEEKRQESK